LQSTIHSLSGRVEVISQFFRVVSVVVVVLMTTVTTVTVVLLLATELALEAHLELIVKRQASCATGHVRVLEALVRMCEVEEVQVSQVVYLLHPLQLQPILSR
jgi:hypothetical protein